MYDIMTEQSLENERQDVYRKIGQKEEEKKREETKEFDRNKRQKVEDSASTANVTIKSF
jgi:hypothetical protein